MLILIVIPFISQNSVVVRSSALGHYIFVARKGTPVGLQPAPSPPLTRTQSASPSKLRDGTVGAKGSHAPRRRVQVPHRWLS